MRPNLQTRGLMRVGTVAFLVAAPFILDVFRLGLLAEMLIFGLAAASLNLLIGVTGLSSLGHAAYFGLGAYAAGLMSVHVSASAWLGLTAAAIAGLVFAAPAGWLSLRTSGVAFLMLSLAFAQILFSASQSWRDVTGGSDGLSGIPNPEILPGLELDSVPWRYYYVAAVFLALYALIRRFVDSPVGWSLRGIRSNPDRMSSLGYNVFAFRYASYMVAGVLCALAGGLYVQYARFTAPENFSFMTSALLLVMVLLGGVNKLHGALVGAAVLILARQELSSRFDTWELGMGVILIIVVYVLPGGLTGRLKFRETHVEVSPSIEEKRA